MANKKKKKKQQADRGEATSSSGSASPASWIGPIAVLVIGVIVIAWQGGFFDGGGTDPPQATTPNTPAQTRSDVKPLVIADSAEVQISGTRSWDQMDDPARDGWETEALHADIKKQLSRLGQLLIAPQPPAAESLSPLLAADFQASLLMPATLTTVFDDTGLLVERGVPADGDVSVRGADDLAGAVAKLIAPLAEAQDKRYEFKVVAVEQDEGRVTTEQLFSISGRTPQGVVEQHATWTTAWVTSPEASPTLKSIRVTRFEQTRPAGSTSTLFADVTASALKHDPSYQSQLLRGATHWFQRIPFRTMVNLFSMPGIAVGDVNGDGREDLYLCQDPGVPNRLFLQNADGTATDVSAAWGVDWLEDARGALLVDLDNDGDQDLVVAIRRHVVLAENENQERFRVRKALTTSEDLTSLVAFDYDADGRLDLYACAYHPNELLADSGGDTIGATGDIFSVHDANNAAANSLFHNETEPGSAWTFVDVTEATGLDMNNSRWSLSASAEDYDNDGDLDLYVANDYGRDNLYRNDAGSDGTRTFVDVGEEAQIENSAAGMAITWGDYDRDGWMDAYVSNMWSSAGHRITSQTQFKPNESEDNLARYRHLAAGNTLLRNQGDKTFSNQSAAAGVAMGRWAWGTRFLDLNNDGWQDLVVANGYMTTDDSGDL